MTAAMHNEDVVFANTDDDDLPPLVDYPAPSMTFTFSTDMTPIIYSNDPMGYEGLPDNTESSIYSPPGSPVMGATRVSHAKKRDASYIPRPPNAFILFRSSFIRAQHVPGKIEGNHSALSKIIGKCWRALPREEREIWEAKAIVAQAEHRKKYPDWRFRPGANALAKVKDGPRRRNNKKGRGEAEKEVKSREKRCAKIADLIVAGKKGPDLEAAIHEYDHEHDNSVKTKSEDSPMETTIKNDVQDSKALVTDKLEPSSPPQVVGEATPQIPTSALVQSKAYESVSDPKFKIPLTAMFKRSSSAPATHKRGVGHPYYYAGRRGSLGAIPSFPACEPLFAGDLAPATGHEAQARVESDTNATHELKNGMASDCMAATQVANSLNTHFDLQHVHDKAGRWNETYVLGMSATQCSSPESVPAFETDTEGSWSPAPSPLADPFSPYQGCDLSAAELGAFSGSKYTEDASHSFHSTYSTLVGWAGDAFAKHDEFFSPESTFPFIPFIAQTPMLYDSDSMGAIKDPFVTTANTVYGGCNTAFSTGAFTDQSYTHCDSLNDPQGLQYWAQSLAQDPLRRQDDLLLFPQPCKDTGGRLVQEV